MNKLQRGACVSLLCFISISFADGMDPVQEALVEYTAKVRSLRQDENATRETKQKFYREWLFRLLEVVDENPSSKAGYAALQDAYSLSNGIGDYETSRKILKKLYDTCSSAKQKHSALSQKCFLAHKQYRRTGEVADAQSASDAFAEMQDLETNHGIKALPEKVILLYNLANIQSKAFADHGASAKLYKEARVLAGTFDNRGRRFLKNLYYDTEQLASKEMLELIRAGDLATADRRLDLIGKQDGLRWPGSYYVKKFCDAAFSGDGLKGDKLKSDRLKYIKKTEEWLSSHKHDAWTPYLQFYLARKYVEAEDVIPAISIYLELDEKYSEIFAKDDKKPIERGRGGYRAEILFNLSSSLSEIGAHAKACTYLEEFINTYPNDARFDSAANLLKSIRRRLGRELDSLHGEVVTEKLEKAEASKSDKKGAVIALAQNAEGAQGAESAKRGPEVASRVSLETRDESSSEERAKRMVNVKSAAMITTVSFLAIGGTIFFFAKRKKTGGK